MSHVKEMDAAVAELRRWRGPRGLTAAEVEGQKLQPLPWHTEDASGMLRDMTRAKRSLEASQQRGLEAGCGCVLAQKGYTDVNWFVQVFRMVAAYGAPVQVHWELGGGFYRG